MRTGVIEANLVTLNQDFQLSYLDELIARKLAGPEKGTLDDGDIEFYQQEHERLRGALEAAFQVSQLPEAPSCRAALNDLLLRLRLNSSSGDV